MKQAIELRTLYFFGVIFVLSSGMFDYLFNNIFTYATIIYLLPAIFLFRSEKSKFLIYFFLLFLLVLLFSIINPENLKYGIELNLERSWQGETERYGTTNLDSSNSFFNLLDSPIITTFKTIIKILILFILFPIKEEDQIKIASLCSTFIYIVFYSVLITSLLINLLNIDPSLIRSFYPITSNINPELETKPFFFIENVFPFFTGIEYVRPYSIFNEPTALGNFIIHIFLINYIIQKKFNFKLFIFTFLILILSIAKFAAVVFFIFYISYFLASKLNDKALAILLVVISSILLWFSLSFIGTGYFILRTLSATLILDHLTFLPNGVNAALIKISLEYGKSANLGAVTILYDLGIILSLLVYSFIIYLFIWICSIKDRLNFAYNLSIFMFFLYTFLLNNQYYSGIFLITFYLYMINRKRKFA